MPENTQPTAILNDDLTMTVTLTLRNKDIIVIKRNGSLVNYELGNIRRAIRQCFKRCHVRYRAELLIKLIVKSNSVWLKIW